jgi:hypothetical protein
MNATTIKNKLFEKFSAFAISQTVFLHTGRTTDIDELTDQELAEVYKIFFPTERNIAEHVFMLNYEKLLKEHVEFDAKNPEHRKAYLMLQYQGRQHDTLRFILKLPYHSVLHMMQAEMAKSLAQKEIDELNIDTSFDMDFSMNIVKSFSNAYKPKPLNVEQLDCEVESDLAFSH